jgi:major vault protein
MGERSNKKIPVTEREFLWVQDDDKGEVVLHTGPTMVSPTAADRVVIDNGEGGFQEDSSGRPQKIIVVGDDQYCVLYNPLMENDSLKPNGNFRQGRNEARPLRNGTRGMIPGPCSFHLWPGQRSEVRDAHVLGSNQYLLVKVYGELNKQAPYYEITVKSAGIRTAIAETVSKDEGDGDSPLLDTTEEVTLTRGQLIVIRGIDTQFYIPPTGVDIVPDTSMSASGDAITANVARNLLETIKRNEESSDIAIATAALDGLAQKNFEGQEEADYAPSTSTTPSRRKEKQAVFDQRRVRPRSQSAREPQMQQMQQMTPDLMRIESISSNISEQMQMDDRLLQMISDSPLLRKALKQEAGKARLVRNAVVLGEKEFCIILDADGKRQVKVGPARVFPGPYDTFMFEGSRNRIYDAYELLPYRALWLRVITQIAAEELAKKLPNGVKLEKDFYYPGDELLLHNVSTFFFPFNEIEVLSPHTGQAVLGNQHEHVFIEAIGIDQKSGIYVRDLDTGEARLVRGQQSYLVDPRKEIHITRTVPAEDWNLWIAHNEPHKKTNQAVVTPWAISVSVPYNHAALATSAKGQRVIEGPCVELLEYEEKLTRLHLSMGRPKSDNKLLETCFLCTTGNRISDIIRVETKDFVQIDIEVSYRVRFKPEAKNNWFSQDNYVQFLVDHMRSLLRGRFRSLTFMENWARIPQILRDTVLGEKPTDGSRPGRFFEENGMYVSEIEVLSSIILDPQIAKLMHSVQSQSVALQIGDREVQDKLSSLQFRDKLEQQQLTLEQEKKKRELSLQNAIIKLEQELKVQKTRHNEELQHLQQELADQRKLLELQSEVEREQLSQKTQIEYQKLEAATQALNQKTLQEVELIYRTALKDIETSLLNAQAQAISQQHQSVQPALIEAMTALGDKIMLAEVAQNMNLVSLFQGKEVGAILSEVLGGTRVIPTLKNLLDKFPSKPNTPKT